MMQPPTDEQIAAMSARELKSLTQRLRRKASRQNLVLRKSRRRDPDATDYGQWLLIRPTGKAIVKGTLADMARYFTARTAGQNGR